MLSTHYFTKPLINCFDNEVIPVPVVNPVAPVAPVVPEDLLSPAHASRVFTQDEVNTIVAREKRQNQAALLKTEDGYKRMLAENQNLSARDRSMLEENLATVQGQLRTKEEQAKIEKKQLEDQLSTRIKDSDERATTWESRYRSETVNRTLQDAAISGEAFQASQIVTILKPYTRLVENVDPKTGKATGRFESVVDFPDKDSEGNPTISTLSPEAAVKRMKDLPETYGNLFKSGVVSGIGANSVTGVTPGANGKLNLRNLDPRQYRELRKNNPEALGLRSRTRR